MKNAKQIFEDELHRRGFSFTIDKGTGLYQIPNRDIKMNVNLENIARNYERNKAPKEIIGFVDKVLGPLGVPDWDKARRLVYFSAEPSDHAFGDTIREKVSDSVSERSLLLLFRNIGERMAADRAWRAGDIGESPCPSSLRVSVPPAKRVVNL